LSPDDAVAPLHDYGPRAVARHLADERHDLARAHVERDEDCFPFHGYILA